VPIILFAIFFTENIAATLIAQIVCICVFLFDPYQLISGMPTDRSGFGRFCSAILREFAQIEPFCGPMAEASNAAS
jgi:hypothetical protein